MGDPLPTEFDLIVVGTGLAESIVSAAASRNGHSVLHLDPREYYGGKWATLCWESLISGSFTNSPQNTTNKGSEFTWTNATKCPEQIWYLDSDDLKKDLLDQSRRFNIDLYPKALLAREEIISLLIGSNVSRYLEFLRIAKLMSSLPSPSESTVESIPLSRSDIFTSKSIGLAEKRGLVKLIEAVVKSKKDNNDSENSNEESTAAAPPQTFDELTKSYNISEKVKHFIKSAVRILDDGFPSPAENDLFQVEFTERCRLFLQSIGRYGNQTPYLWTLYGISEICQAFCRLSAVYKGIFILNRFVDNIKETETGFHVVAKDVEADTKYLVVAPEIKFGKGNLAKPTKTIARGILLTNAIRIKRETDEKPGVDGSMLYMYKIGEMEILELDHTSQAVPKNYGLVQVTFPYTTTLTPREIIETTLSPFLNFQPIQKSENTKGETSENVNEVKSENDHDETISENGSFSPPPSEDPSPPPSKPQVLYGFYFLMDFFENESFDSNSKIFSCATDSTEITAEVNKAREIFEKMYPGEDFLPKAPDAEDEEEYEEDEELTDEPMGDTAESHNNEKNVEKAKEVSNTAPTSDSLENFNAGGDCKEGEGDQNK